MEIEGVIKVIGEEKQVSDKFKRRELVVTTEDQYPQHILIEFTQDKCNLVDNRNVGDRVKVHINLRGREYVNKTTGEIKYFNSVQGWKIELVGASTPEPVAVAAAQAAAPAAVAKEGDEVPF